MPSKTLHVDIRWGDPVINASTAPTPAGASARNMGEQACGCQQETLIDS